MAHKDLKAMLARRVCRAILVLRAFQDSMAR